MTHGERAFKSNHVHVCMPPQAKLIARCYGQFFRHVIDMTCPCFMNPRAKTLTLPFLQLYLSHTCENLCSWCKIQIVQNLRMRLKFTHILRKVPCKVCLIPRPICHAGVSTAGIALQLNIWEILSWPLGSGDEEGLCRNSLVSCPWLWKRLLCSIVNVRPWACDDSPLWWDSLRNIWCGPPLPGILRRGRWRRRFV